jgi:hypothetical protein
LLFVGYLIIKIAACNKVSHSWRASLAAVMAPVADLKGSGIALFAV